MRRKFGKSRTTVFTKNSQLQNYHKLQRDSEDVTLDDRRYSLPIFKQNIDMINISFQNLKKKRMIRRATVFDKESIQNQFRNWYKIRQKGKYFEYKEIQKIRKVFNMLDKDNSGSISADQLFIPLISLGLVKSMAQVQSMINQVTQTKNGEINFFQFQKIIQLSYQKKKKIDFDPFLQNIMSPDCQKIYSLDLFFNKIRRDKLMGIIRSKDSFDQQAFENVSMFRSIKDLQNIRRNSRKKCIFDFEKKKKFPSSYL